MTSILHSPPKVSRQYQKEGGAGSLLGGVPESECVCGARSPPSAVIKAAALAVAAAASVAAIFEMRPVVAAVVRTIVLRVRLQQQEQE